MRSEHRTREMSRWPHEYSTTAIKLTHLKDETHEPCLSLSGCWWRAEYREVDNYTYVPGVLTAVIENHENLDLFTLRC